MRTSRLRKRSRRPHGWVLRHLLKQGEGQDLLDAARRVGRELVEGDMSAETLAAVSRELVTFEECMWMQEASQSDNQRSNPEGDTDKNEHRFHRRRNAVFVRLL